MFARTWAKLGPGPLFAPRIGPRNHVGDYPRQLQLLHFDRPLISGTHCMLSPLAHIASMLVIQHLLENRMGFNEQCLFSVLLSQIAVRSHSVLADMMFAAPFNFLNVVPYAAA